MHQFEQILIEPPERRECIIELGKCQYYKPMANANKKVKLETLSRYFMDY